MLFCIFLRKFGSTPELAGENSPSVSLSSSDCPPLLPGEELLEAGEFRWPGWIFIAFLFRRSPEGLLGLLPASSWIIIPETEGKSSEFRTRLRGGDDIYQVKKSFLQGFLLISIFCEQRRKLSLACDVEMSQSRKREQFATKIVKIVINRILPWAKIHSGADTWTAPARVG